MIQASSLLYVFSAWFFISGTVRFIYKYRKANKEPASPKSVYPALPSIIMAAASAFLCISAALGTQLFFSGSLLTSIIVISVAMLFAACADAFSSYLFPVLPKLKMRKFISPLFSLLFSLLVLSFVLYMRSAPIFSKNKMALIYPVKGEWKIAAGGRTTITNYHHGNPNSQNYAVDLISCDGNSSGKIIYSPANGKVIEAIGNRNVESAEPEGNLIIIQTDNNTQIWLAHLETGSVKVKKGDYVAAGQEIAKCGSTGSAAQPHLHIHAQKENKPAVMLFGNNKKFLLKNDKIRTNNP